MVGVLGCPVVFPERQPAEPAVVVLHKLPVSLGALLFGKFEAFPFTNHLTDEIVEIGFGAVGASAVRSQISLHLQQAHIDSHLKHLAAVACLDAAGGHFTWGVVPVLQDSVDITG